MLEARSGMSGMSASSQRNSPRIRIILRKYSRMLGVAEAEGKQDFDCVLVKMFVTRLVRKYGVYRTNQMLTDVWMMRVKVNEAGTDLPVEIRSEHSADKAPPSLLVDYKEAQLITVKSSTWGNSSSSRSGRCVRHRGL